MTLLKLKNQILNFNLLIIYILMNYLLYTINILLITGILYTIYKNFFLREGLDGCPANSQEESRNRNRNTKKNEVDNTIANLKAEISLLNMRITAITMGVDANKKELEKVSDAAAQKAKKTKTEMDKIKN
tara:strand:+ start:457 stop:846 length:390 start_codon:yes stop_codon:yes gene_type:complete